MITVEVIAGYGEAPVGVAIGLLRDELRRTRPDLVVLDLMLPDISGLELLERLGEDRVLGDLPVIILSARGSTEDRVLGLELGAVDYIPKPFSPRELVSRVRAV